MIIDTKNPTFCLLESIGDGHDIYYTNVIRISNSKEELESEKSNLEKLYNSHVSQLKNTESHFNFNEFCKLEDKELSKAYDANLKLTNSQKTFRLKYAKDNPIPENLKKYFYFDENNCPISPKDVYSFYYDVVELREAYTDYSISNISKNFNS